MIMIGILMKANIADVPVIVTAEPRPAIIAFLFAAIWNAIHFEWMMQLHHNANHLMNQNYCSNSNSNNTNNRNTESVDIVGKYNYNHNDVTSRECDSNDNNNKDDDDNNKMNSHSMTHMDEMHKKQEEDVSDVVYNGVNVSNIDEEKDTTNGAEHVNVLVSNGRKSTRNDAIVMHLRFQDSDDSKSYLECKSQLCLQVFVIMLLLTVVTTYIAGCILELVRFTTFVGDDTVGCIKSYNLYTIATELVSDFFSYGNSAKFGAWILCISYILFIGVCPIFVHLVHIMVFAFQMKCTKSICRAADMSWSFASVEIMLLALIIVQVRVRGTCNQYQ